MSHYAFNWFALAPLLTAACTLGMTVTLYRRERSSRVGQALLLVTGTVTYWLVTSAMMYFSADESTAMLWARITYIIVPMLPVAIYLYVSVGLRIYQHQRVTLWAAFLTSFVFVLFAYNTDLLLSGVENRWWGYYPTYGVLGPGFMAYFALVILLGFVRLHMVLQETPKRSLSHRRTEMATIAVGVAAIGAVDFLPKFGVTIYPFGFVAVLFFVVIVMVMERRYRIVYMTPAFAAAKILQTMQGSVLVATLEGQVEVQNRAAAELLDVGESEIPELSLDQVFASRGVWRSMIDDLTAGEQVKAYETGWKRRNGETVDVSVSASLIEGAKGRPLGIVFAALDITAHKQAQAALKESEARLLQSQKMEAVGQLAGGIAHDFNNMLTAIIGNASLALSLMPPDDPNQALIADIREVGERAAALTSQILAFSRRQMLRPEVTSLNRVVGDMEGLLRRTIGEDIELKLLLAPDLCASEVDPHQFGQVVLNLAVNARDAMPAGGRLVIETANVILNGTPRKHRELAPGEYAALVVSDNGCGMSEETQTRLFEPFYTTKGAGRGTGLGLSTVFGIVKQSGGGVYVYSEQGVGSTFKIYVPVSTAPRAANKVVRSHDTTVHRGTEAILVVEDESQVRDLVVRVLSRAGYRVKAAASAETAARILDATDYEPELLLTDVVLPGGVNGREVADRMLARFPDLKVVFMSGYTRNAVVHDGRLDEGIAFLEKPFTPDALLRKLRDALDPRPGSTAG